MTTKAKKTLFFTMINHPVQGWIRVGRPYPSRRAANEWMPFVRGSWRGLQTKVSQLTVKLVDGRVCEASRRVLDQKFNLDA